MTDDLFGQPTVRRVMGLESEFGVIATTRDASGREQHQAKNPMLLSHHIVSAYSLLIDGTGQRVRWDYGDESPLRDLRGFELPRAAAAPSQLTDSPAFAGEGAGEGADPGADPGAPPGRELRRYVVEGLAKNVSAEYRESVRLESDLLGFASGSGHVSERREYFTVDRSDPLATLRAAAKTGVGNAVISNGARLYVDHAHPEYSSPEVLTPREAVTWDRAGDLIAEDAMRAIAAIDGLDDITLFKNNTDGKGATYGTHENYLTSRDVPFDHVVAALTPFFVTRQIFTGAGRVGLGQRGERPGYQISQRADYFENEVGLETTLNRPIINTRDEPHSDRGRFRRLHVIVGDANLMDVPNLLKMGTTSLVLAMLEAGFWGQRADLASLRLAEPVEDMHRVSHDTSLTRELVCADGTRLTALDIQRRYLAAARDFVGPRPDRDTAEVLHYWAEVLDGLAVDPLRCAGLVEWVAKYRLLNGLREKHDLPWSAPQLAMIDVQFSDLRREKSLYQRLRAKGSIVELIADADAARAKTTPPESTRAYLRGHAIERFRDEVTAASWDSLIFDLGADQPLQRILLDDPLSGTAAATADLLARAGSASELLAGLGADLG
ncbi:proteasome accessory factor PafA2 [Micrococcales bacterium 31B]|nr:proteasome accessory factor PafA2 [Micrococcales bacterium 31B]